MTKLIEAQEAILNHKSVEAALAASYETIYERAGEALLEAVTECGYRGATFSRDGSDAALCAIVDANLVQHQAGSSEFDAAWARPEIQDAVHLLKQLPSRQEWLEVGDAPTHDRQGRELIGKTVARKIA